MNRRSTTVPIVPRQQRRRRAVTAVALLLASFGSGACATAPSSTSAAATPPATSEPVSTNAFATPDDATQTASGLTYKRLQAGQGTRHASATARVTVHYSGWTTDGVMFDSSVARGEPATFPLNRVIAGWTEGVQLMVEGETTRFWIPAALAYGDNPPAGAPRGMLIFDIELLEIVD